MTAAGVCSGVGGFDLAFHIAGAQLLWACELDAPCRLVLKHRFPDLTQYQDMMTDKLLQDGQRRDGQRGRVDRTSDRK